MRMLVGSIAISACLVAGPSAAQGPPPDPRIAEAVESLPPELKDTATVVTYGAPGGDRVVLRQGTGFLECQPRAADGFTRCYHKAAGPRRDLEARLRAQKKSDADVSAAIAAATAAGTIPSLPAQGTMSYRGSDARDRIQRLWVMSLPDRTPESVGVSDVSQRDAALGGKGLPWMMAGGTPAAHIMIPIAPRAGASTVADEAPDEVTQATLPLPDDLRAGAAVFRYDVKTGERITLRQGTNAVECTPRGNDGFTWCYHKATGPRRDLAARLRAQGKPPAEVQAAVAAATAAGTIPPAPWGTLSYRLYGKQDRIQLLWVLSVPGATAESIGVSDADHREDALGGRGVPWLMLAGTPGAHVMIPINR